MLRPSRWSPATRVAAGLASLMISLVLLADICVGFLPNRLDAARRERSAITRKVASEIVLALRADPQDAGGLQRTLAASVRQGPDTIAGALRTADGQMLARVGHDARLAAQPVGSAARSSLEDVTLPITADGKAWGELQLLFKPAIPHTLGGWAGDPMVRALLLIAGAGFCAFWLYLRRVLRYLDPNSAVPERVRTAFDTLSEGVLVFDGNSRVMLANKAVQNLGAAPIGASATALAWLTRALPGSDASPPWETVMQHKRPQLGDRIRIEGAGGGARELVMNCSPITDGGSGVRGCLVTFSDVTELHERTESLRVALEQLSASQAEIERQNEELTRLATRDPLTGCLNRRSLMAQADESFAKARAAEAPLSCVMCDIDHFKSVNDRYGHAAGDQVIQAAAKALSRGLRVGDFLGRYGGEEFCIMLPGATLAQTMEVAERLRADVEATVGAAMRDHPGVKITMSFGVAPFDARAAADDPAALIDRADQALYRSKKGGRNRVTAWEAAEISEPA